MQRLKDEQKKGGFFFGISNAAAVQHELQTLDYKGREAAKRRRRRVQVAVGEDVALHAFVAACHHICLLYTSPSPRDRG